MTRLSGEKGHSRTDDPPAFNTKLVEEIGEGEHAGQTA